MAMRDAAPARTFGSDGGTLGKLIDDHDWGATSLGPIASWPAAMRTTVELVLRSPAPLATLWGREGVMIYNAGYAAIAASRHPAMLGTPVCEAWPEAAGFNANVLNVVLAGHTLSYREQLMTLERDGRAAQCWFDLDYSPVADVDGTVLGVMAVVVESSAKVRAEAGLDAEHSRLRAIFQQAPGFVAQLTGPDHMFALVNAAYSTLIGERPVLGMPARLALPETVPQGFVDHLDRVYRTGQPFAATAAPLWLSQGGNQRRLYYIDFTCQPLRGEDGSVNGVFVQGHDVTERVLAEQARHESDARFHSFAQAMPHQVWSASADGKNDWFNDHAYAYSGLTLAELGGTGWTSIVHPDDLAEVTTRWAIAVASGSTYEAEMRLRAQDDSYRWHLCRAVPLREAEGEGGSKIRGWVGTNTDIEDRKQDEQRLALLNANLEQQVAQRTAERDRMWRLSKDIMLVASFDGRVEAVSPAFASLLGWSETDIAGRNFMELVHPDDHASTLAQMASLGTGHYVYKFENRYRRKDGSWCLLSWSAAPDAAFIHAIGRDITADREQAEQIRRTELALQQSQKMETIGKLTGGVAHDFNNLLQIISGNLQLLEVHCEGAEVQRWIANSRSAVEKGAKLASYLLAFGRRQPLEPRVVKVSRIVMGMEDMLRRALGEEIEVELVISGGLWNTAVDVAQVENAVLNLAINARDAMSGRGRLTIEANNAVLDDLYCRNHGDVAPGQYVMLGVTDTGTGMVPEVLRQAFEPFFSTKDEGKGTGLGLSMVYGFVKQSGGHVKIYSEPGQGTTVKIYLPRTLAAVEDALAPVVEPQQAVGGTETILVAEDDEAVRTTVVEMLTDLGYRVLKAADAASALAVVESGVPIDVLFTDVVMPGTLRSPELARMARERLQNLAVLFTSGYTENAIVHGGRLDAGVELLGKPYTRESLARRIRQVLANQRGRALGEPPVIHPRAEGGDGEARASLRIVLVEDEEEIRDATEALLQHLGHEVRSAGTAEEALELISSESDLLITDVQLPGMSGDMLAAEARVLAPGIRIVFATGKGEVNNWPDAVVLRKPYDLTALSAVLAGVTAPA